MLSDYRLLGEDLWTRFNGGKEGTLWYYRAVVDVLSTENESPLVEELDRVVSEMERLALNWGGSSVRRGVRNGRV